MPKTSEIAFNNQFGETLRRKHPLFRNRLFVEQTGVISNNLRLQPDILILPTNAQPVVVETEYQPAKTVENDAKSRLGLIPLDSLDPIEQAIAVQIPVTLQQSQLELSERIEKSNFKYCVLSGDLNNPDRFPSSGWLEGGVNDIVRCIEFAMVSQRLVNESISVLESGVGVATKAIQNATELGFTDIEPKLGEVLNQHPSEQTTRMAMTIVANAMTFHSTLAGTHGISDISELQAHTDSSFRVTLLNTWQRILEEINYWPIFKVASTLLSMIRSETASRVLRSLVAATDRLAELGVTTRHDLSGRMFQTLITDRKFLATFYTLPTSATLLAEIAVSRLNCDWNELDSYSQLRIADLSCGTGTLLSSAYHSVLTKYRHAGGDDADVHRSMIENAVIAADIMPAATNLCASQLASVHPAVTFDNTRVYTMPYGGPTSDAPDRNIAIGSLDLIVSESSSSLFATGQQQTTGSQGESEVRDINVPNESLDLVIMNPPFTRPTNHERTDVPVPSFAGFQTTADEQRAMSNRLKAINSVLSNRVGNGNAGLASNFVDLAHIKIKTGGTIALVLPAVSIQGEAWKDFRVLLDREYENVIVITIANPRTYERAFSADTGLAEVLIIATKRERATGDTSLALYVNLRDRPSTILEASEVAKAVLDSSGPSGYLQAGGQVLGNFVRAPLDEGGSAALHEFYLVDVMSNLAQGRIRIPRLTDTLEIPMTTLDELGQRGLLHRDIGTKKDEVPPYRGPFKIVPIQGQTTYPTLWNHNASNERYLSVQADSDAEVRPGCEQKANYVWDTATRLHYTLAFRLNSQSLAACLTKRKSIGGSAWPNYRLHDAKWECLLALWANSTLGLMSFWWIGSRQQSGRSVLTVSTLPKLLSVDPRRLLDSKIALSDEIFEDFQSKPLLPANEAFRDETRIALDRALLIDVLDLPNSVLDPLENLRAHWCGEPSVHGGKSSAIDNFS